jgi:hypothetical protein
MGTRSTRSEAGPLSRPAASRRLIGSRAMSPHGPLGDIDPMPRFLGEGFGRPMTVEYPSLGKNTRWEIQYFS